MEGARLHNISGGAVGHRAIGPRTSARNHESHQPTCGTDLTCRVATCHVVS